MPVNRERIQAYGNQLVSQLQNPACEIDEANQLIVQI